MNDSQHSPTHPFSARWRDVIGLGCLLTVPFSVVAEASGPCPRADYLVTQYEPGTPQASYFEGDLGVLRREMGPAFLLIAYAGLVEDDWSKSQPVLRRLQDYLEPQPSQGPPNWRREWVTEVRAAGVDRKRHEYIPSSTRESIEHQGASPRIEYRTRPTCLDHAFETAIETYQDRQEEPEYDNARLSDWLMAQEQVFGNCAGEDSIPEQLDETAPKLARHDRDYQIAAALLYAGREDEAAKRFEQIDREEDSPWQSWGLYLAARSWLTRSLWRDDPAALRSAQELVERVLSRSDLRDRHPAAQALADRIAARRDRLGRAARLASSVLSAEAEVTRQDVIDLFFLLPAQAPTTSSHGSDALDWLSALADRSNGHTYALSRWRTAGEKHWLAAALMTAERAMNLEQELAAAEAITSQDRLWSTLRYHWARLRVAELRTEPPPVELHGQIEQILADHAESFALPDLNRWLDLATATAPDWQSLRRHATRRVLASVDYDCGLGYRLKYEPTGGSVEVFGDGVTERLNLLASPEVMFDFLGNTDPEPLVLRLARVGWTRAVVLDHPIARQFAERLVELDPKLAPALQQYLAASGDEARFLAALTLLDRPGLAPFLRARGGRPEPLTQRTVLGNWWCSASSMVPDSRWKLLAFPGFGDLQVHQQQWDRLRSAGSSTEFLSQIVFEWADRHRDDRRVPRALHRVVYLTRYGCSSSVASQAAFNRLHRRYPGHEWTVKTPYWFR